MNYETRQRVYFAAMAVLAVASVVASVAAVLFRMRVSRAPECHDLYDPKCNPHAPCHPGRVDP